MTADRLLTALKERPLVTVSELMDATGLSRTAVHKVSGELVALGLAHVADADTPGRRGRPPSVFSFAADAGALLSIDFGVNTLQAVVADLRGNAKGRAVRHVEDPSTPDRERILEDVLDAALADSGVPAERVRVAVVGVPMALSSNASVHYPERQRGVDIAREWGRRHGWPVLVENDANLAALGERRFGVARASTDVVTLLAGERFGAGIVSRGVLVRGAHGSAGELRFLSRLPGAAPEYVGIAPQARALAQLALDEGWATDGLLAAVEADGGRIHTSSIFRAAEAGDASALSIVRALARRLADVVGVIATLLDPDMVVISGGLADAGALLARTTEALLPAWIIDNPPRVVASTLGANAVVTGGISLALDHLDRHLLDDLDAAERPHASAG